MKLKKMRSLFVFCSLIILLFTQCSTADLAPIATSTINEAAVSNTEELLLELEIKPSVSPDRFVVLDSIKNVIIKINSDVWGIFNYYEDNQIRFNDLVLENGFSSTANEFSHKLVLDYLTIAEDYTSAGEFADYLNNFLQPGDYFCQVESFSIFDNQGVETEIDVYQDFILNIELDEHSVYLGTLNLEL